jgi:hypothetical protein
MHVLPLHIGQSPFLGMSGAPRRDIPRNFMKRWPAQRLRYARGYGTRAAAIAKDFSPAKIYLE